MTDETIWRPDRTKNPDLMRSKQMLSDAWSDDENTPNEERLAAARKALRISPLNSDAHVHLAMFDESLPIERKIETLRKAVAVAEEVLGTYFFEENRGSFGATVSGRSYLRARSFLASHLKIFKKQEDDAVAHFKEIIKLELSDPMLCRIPLAAMFAEMGRHEELETLAARFGTDVDTLIPALG